MFPGLIIFVVWACLCFVLFLSVDLYWPDKQLTCVDLCLPVYLHLGPHLSPLQYIQYDSTFITVRIHTALAMSTTGEALLNSSLAK